MASRSSYSGRSLSRLGLLVVAGCLASAGCSSGLGDAAGSGPTTASDLCDASPGEPKPDADPDRAVSAAVDATLAAPCFTLSSDADLTVGPQRVRLNASGSVNYPGLVADLAVSVESGGTGGEFEVRSDGTTVWLRAEGDGATELDLPDGKDWIEGEATRLTELGSFDQSGLLGVLLTLRAAEGTETTGTDTLDDTEVTRYRTSVTYEDALEAAVPDADALERALSLDAPTPVNLDIDVAVGSDGVIREFVLTGDADGSLLELTADYRVSLTNVGLEVAAPEPPPRDKTVTGPQAETILDGLSG